MFSRRLAAAGELNALSRQIARDRAEGIAFADLTASNPTRVGLPYPANLLEGLADARALTYDPEAQGSATAREAIAADAARRGASLDPGHIVLTASTSEAYSWLFKLLCDPGDAVLVPRPSYPLFEHLTQLESVVPLPYDLEYHGQWSIDFDGIAEAPATVRAVLVVSPNNPTGSYLSRTDYERLAAICRRRGWALIADEVFADYPLDAVDPLTDVHRRGEDDGILSVTLSGASKMLGLPQVKLGWMVIGGPATVRQAAMERLELIADTFLSVSTPVQVAAAALLRQAMPVRSAIHQRIRSNLEHARRIVRRHPSCELLRVDGGWSAVVRVPAIRSEEQLILALLADDRVLVHPGYFFDFAREAFVIVSLLPDEGVFADAFARVLRRAAS